MLLTPLPLTPPLRLGGGSTYHAVIRRRFTKSVHCGACATQFVKNIGVFDSPRVRFRILSSSSGTSPASPASSASAPAKDADDARDAGDVAHAGALGGKGKSFSGGTGRGKDLRKEKGKIAGGEKALGGKGGTGSQQGEGGKHRREEKGKTQREKGP